MLLTDTEKDLVTESFAKVTPIAEQAARFFYKRLWEIDPSTTSLFQKTDMDDQGRKLIQTLATAIGALRHLDIIEPFIQQLGKRHIAYGVTKQQYDSVGSALIWALEQSLHVDFTPEVKDAWIKVYKVLAEIATRAYPEKPTAN